MAFTAFSVSFLQHWSFFVSIDGTVTMIRPKSLIGWNWYWVYALSVVFLEHWRLFYFNNVRLAKYGKNFYFMALKLSYRHLLSIGGIVAKIQAKTFICRIWNWVYGICRSIFITLQVYLHRLGVLLPRYGWKRLFASFEIGLTAFAVVFLEHWRLFCFD